MKSKNSRVLLEQFKFLLFFNSTELLALLQWINYYQSGTRNKEEGHGDCLIFWYTVNSRGRKLKDIRCIFEDCVLFDFFFLIFSKYFHCNKRMVLSPLIEPCLNKCWLLKKIIYSKFREVPIDLLLNYFFKLYYNFTRYFFYFPEGVVYIFSMFQVTLNRLTLKFDFCPPFFENELHQFQKFKNLEYIR